MKKLLRKKEYDTETAELVKKHTEGEFGDPCGYEETLYRTPDGALFLYVNGGENSPHPKEDIKCISKEKAKVWLESH